MAKPHQNKADYQRHHRAQTSKAMRRLAKANQCPQCGRKAAVKTLHEGDFHLRYCRWDDCDYEKGRYLSQ